MKDQLTISISSINGSKHWHFSKRARVRFKAFCYAIFTVATFTILTLAYLYHTVDDFQLRNAELIGRSEGLAAELDALNQLKDDLENDLIEREERVEFVSDRLADIEQLLNVDKLDEQTSLEFRLDAANIASSTRLMMLSQIPNGSPVAGNQRISSKFGMRTHPITKAQTMHRGIDFAVNTGTKVFAPADGVIEVTRKSDQGSGNFLRIQHAFGFASSYSHLHQFKVRPGQFVRKGDLVAISGNSGLSSGPHLHYEVRYVGRALDPARFVAWGVDDFESIFVNEGGVPWESLVETVETRVAQLLPPSSPKAVTRVAN